MNPTKYSPKFAKELIDGARLGGQAVLEICQKWGISRTTYYNWMKDHPEFAEAHEHGERDAACWYHEQARKLITGELKGNAGVICFALKNIEGINWTDKVDIHRSSDEEVQTIRIEVLPSQQLPQTKVINAEGNYSLTHKESD